MTFNRDFFTSHTGQVVLVAAVLLLGILAVRWQNEKRTPVPLPAAKSAPSVALPKTLTREITRYKTPPPVPAKAAAHGVTSSPPAVATIPATQALPLALLTAGAESSPVAPRPPVAPFGRLIPCETVIALESNRLETPVIGLVTQDVWHDGRLIIPAGAEVHARAALDRTRERLAVQGPWKIVWRTPDADNGAELSVDGLALDRDYAADTGTWGPNDGSAGLRGQIVKADDDRELKLLAATFLGSATAALQDTRLTTGLLGEASLPTASARNAALSGTSAVLREYAQAMRDSIARDGFFLRVPAGKPFYLYVTQTLDLAQASRPGTASSRL
ncbi:MAG: TrbI/VirB10 family protein [Opitutaceae bacterium]|nr:TrbI/VirB10 family protein [Opitutaceae bacterium]